MLGSHFFRFILNIFLPPRCALCKKLIQDNHALCPDCFKEIHFIEEPVCPICGIPLEYENKENCICPTCLSKKRPYGKARSAFVYDSFSRQLILPFKHADKTELTPFLENLLWCAGKDLIQQCDMIVPVPLHWKRLLHRKYNQAGLLARQLAKRAHKTYAITALIRVQNTHSQSHLSPTARNRNVRTAFKTSGKINITGKHILLVDDVRTTEATINACTRELLKAGATKVDVLTLAMVIKK